MSEENMPVENIESQVPEPQATEAPAPAPAEVNLDSKITFDGKEVSVSELIEQNREVDRLREYRENATALMQGDNVPTEKREQAMRYLLAQEGYASSQIEEYIQATREASMPPQENQIPENPQQPQQMSQEDRLRMAELESRQARLNVEMMKRDLDTAVENTMAHNPRIRALVNKSKELNGDEGADSRIDSIREEVRRATMDQMRQRKSSGERFDNTWFNQETEKAADAVYERIRSVIGDPDKIQRAPETASDADSFVNTPPVAAPNFEKGDNMGSAQTKSHDWTVDALSRLAQDASDGGETKL